MRTGPAPPTKTAPSNPSTFPAPRRSACCSPSRGPRTSSRRWSSSGPSGAGTPSSRATPRTSSASSQPPAPSSLSSSSEGLSREAAASVEVPRRRPDSLSHPERRQRAHPHVHHLAVPLHPALRDDEGRSPHERPEPLVHVGHDDQVGDAGLVLQAREDDARRRGRPLANDDQARH